MKYSTPEQEQIIQMLRDGNCGEILKMISEKDIRKYSPSYISCMLLELIPQTSRDSKQLEDLIVKYGKPDWNARGREGRMLHAVFIRYNRVDLAVRAVENLRKKDVQRTAILGMIRQGVMSCMDEDEKKRVLKQILLYEDISILEAAGKDIEEIPVSLLQVPDHLSGQRFVREMLNRYCKKIHVEEDIKTVWEITLKCGAEGMVRYLLKKTGTYEYLPEIAAGSDDMFRLILTVRCRNILDEVKREVLYGTLESSSAKERFELLVNKGWARSSRERKKKIPLADEYVKRMQQKRYAADKSGRLEQIKDQTGMRILISYEQENI